MINNLHNFNSRNLNTHPVAGISFLPARLNADETAKILGFQEHDVRILVAEKLLKPLGKPAKNAPKYFATADVYSQCSDSSWLNKATQKIYEHWQQKNGRKVCEPHAQETSLAA